MEKTKESIFFVICHSCGEEVEELQLWPIDQNCTEFGFLCSKCIQEDMEK